MTKHVRIENADTSDYKVLVFVEELQPSDDVQGVPVWVRYLPGTVELNHPTAMVTSMVHGTRRLVIEEVPS